MNEAKKNIWKPIAIVALVIALIACAALVYLMNRAPEKESVKEARGLALDSISDTTDVLERDTVVFPCSTWTAPSPAKRTIPITTR